MSIFDDLISKSSDLEQTASQIQIKETVGLSTEQINKLIEDYDDWYTDCLAILPDDLQKSFRSAYEGGMLQSKIQDFLANPTKRYQFYIKDNPLTPYWQASYETSFEKNIRVQRRLLIEASKRKNSNTASSQEESVKLVINLCRKFHAVAHQLTKRHDERETIKIEDEYDTQDLFRALLHLHFEDIRPEECAPSYGGKNSRTDFFLKNEKIIIELKKTRRGLTRKEVLEQLIIDKECYRSHPDYKTLIAFVYDPERRIDNPKGVEKDLSEVKEDRTIIVIVNQG